MKTGGRIPDKLHQAEFDRVVQQISCEHLLVRYEHIAEYPDARNLRELDTLARKGDCQFAPKCRHRVVECNRNANPDKITFGIPKVPSGKCYQIDDID